MFIHLNVVQGKLTKTSIHMCPFWNTKCSISSGILYISGWPIILIIGDNCTHPLNGHSHHWWYCIHADQSFILSFHHNLHIFNYNICKMQMWVLMRRCLVCLWQFLLLGKFSFFTLDARFCFLGSRLWSLCILGALQLECKISKIRSIRNKIILCWGLFIL